MDYCEGGDLTKQIEQAVVGTGGTKLKQQMEQAMLECGKNCEARLTKQLLAAWYTMYPPPNGRRLSAGGSH